MTTNGFSFRLAALCACVAASYTFAQSNASPYPECEVRAYGEEYLWFGDCKVTNFSAHLPVPPSIVVTGSYNATILDIDGCVRFLRNISQLNTLAFGKNDPSFLDCLTKFNRSLPLTPTTDYGPAISIESTDLPLDEWFETNFKILFGDTTYFDYVFINEAKLVTRVPKAFGNKGEVSLNWLRVTNTNISEIREHDFDGYRFVKDGNYGPYLAIGDNRICVVELAAFRQAQEAHISIGGNPIDENGNIKWTELANRYPNATAFATNPVCAYALDTACYRVIDTSYNGISIMQRVCAYPTTTTKVASTEETSKLPSTEETAKPPLPTTSEKSSDTPPKSFGYEAVKIVKFAKVKILGGNEAEVSNLSKSKSNSLFDSDSDSNE